MRVGHEYDPAKCAANGCTAKPVEHPPFPPRPSDVKAAQAKIAATLVSDEEALD